LRQTVTVFDRASKKRMSVGLDELEKFVHGFSMLQHQELYEKAESLMNKFLGDAETLEKARSAISSSGRSINNPQGVAEIRLSRPVSPGSLLLQLLIDLPNRRSFALVSLSIASSTTK